MSEFILGLTGGIASGKSTVERLFTAHGVVVVDADQLARELVMPGQPALAEIAAAFGEDVIDASGDLNRPALRQRIFADETARKRLESILHPRIRSLLFERCRAAPGRLAIASIPLLSEGGGRQRYPWLWRILVVDVSPATQLTRLMQRDGGDEAQARRILAAQSSRERRLQLADDILQNEQSPQDLVPRVSALLQFYWRLIDKTA